MLTIVAMLIGLLKIEILRFVVVEKSMDYVLKFIRRISFFSLSFFLFLYHFFFFFAKVRLSIL